MMFNQERKVVEMKVKMILVCLFLFVISGCGYTWFDGKKYSLDSCLNGIRTSEYKNKSEQLRRFRAMKGNELISEKSCSGISLIIDERCRKVERTRYLLNSNSNFKHAILQGYLVLGMTEKDARASRGGKYTTNRTVSKYGTSEQWVYWDSCYKPKYLYFDDGILTAWQN